MRILLLAACVVVVSTAAHAEPRWGWGVHYTFRDDAGASLIPGVTGSQLERRVHDQLAFALVFDGFSRPEAPSMFGGIFAARAQRSMLRLHLAVKLGNPCGLFVQAGAGVASDHITYTISGIPIDEIDGGDTYRPHAFIGGGYHVRIAKSPFSVGMELRVHSLFGASHHAEDVMDPPTFDARAAEMSVVVNVHP